jgi:hypothetical protein
MSVSRPWVTCASTQHPAGQIPQIERCQPSLRRRTPLPAALCFVGPLVMVFIPSPELRPSVAILAEPSEPVRSFHDAGGRKLRGR